MYRTTLRNKVVAASALLLVAPSLYKVEDPLELRVNSRNKSLLMKVCQQSPEIKNMVFRPTYQLSNGHFNSIHTGLSSRWNNYMNLAVNNKSEVFKLSDGGEILLNFSVKEKRVDAEGKGDGQSFTSSQEERPLIVIIPGLLSTIDDHHIHTFVQTAQENGYDWVLINYRGVHVPIKNGKPLSFQDFESFKEPLRHILDQNKVNGRKIFIFGSSLGGNFVANIICDKEFDTGRIAAVACLCPALDLEKSLRHSNEALNGFYGWNFVSSFKNSVQGSIQSIESLRNEYDRIKNITKLHGKDTFEKIMNESNTLIEIQERLWLPIFGMKNLCFAHREASSIYKLENLSHTPMFILKAKDDPVIGPDSVNVKMALDNPNIIVGETNYGGHLGYFESYTNRSQFHCQPIISFMNAFKN